MRFGVGGLIVLIAVVRPFCLGPFGFSRDSRPAYLYAGWLDDADDPRRAQAAQELGRLDDETSVVVASLVRALLTDHAVAVRKQSAQSLGQIASKQDDGSTTAAAARALARALTDKDKSVRAAVADALGQIASEPDVAVPELLRAAGDLDEMVRGKAVAALGLIQKKARIDRPDVRIAISAAGHDPSLHVRESGIYAFWATAEGSPAFSRTLLNANDVHARRTAVHALARNGPLAEKVSRELTARLTDADADVRAGAARALENMGINLTPE